jgi:gas vesicle protein
MDETNGQETLAGDEATEERTEAAPAEPECCKRGGGRFIGGLLSGAVVGGALALLLAPLRGEERARREMMESGRWESREGLEQEGGLRAQVAVERVQAVAGGVVSRIEGVWAAVWERLHEAVEEGKEGIAEGQEEARTRYETMTRRRRRR